MTLRRPLFIILMVVTSIALMSVSFRNTTSADSPSSCVNRYDTTIVSLKITDVQGRKSIDPIANPKTQFASRLGVGYTVTLTLHSAGTSSSGNTDVGSLWYGSTARGFADDHCVNGVNPNSDTTIILHNIFMGQATHGTMQPVQWYTFPLSGPTVVYTVHWH